MCVCVCVCVCVHMTCILTRILYFKKLFQEFIFIYLLNEDYERLKNI